MTLDCVCNFNDQCFGVETIEMDGDRPRHTRNQRCVIFLDIDGVVHPANQAAFIHGLASAMPPQLLSMIDGCFRPQCLDRLKRVIDKTNALVVLSSTWRETSDLLAQAQKRLAMCGITVHDTTPIMQRNYGRSHMRPKGRSQEINWWLQKHRGDVSSFVVVDDMDMTPQFQQNCVVVDGRTGLTEDDVERIMVRLLSI